MYVCVKMNRWPIKKSQVKFTYRTTQDINKQDLYMGHLFKEHHIDT